MWYSLCTELGIDQNISEEWLITIKKQYGSTRFNEEFLLNKKLEFLMNSNSKAIFLATVFHYFNFDIKRNCSEENCDTFKLFVEQAKIQDVSIIKSYGVIDWEIVSQRV